ncbi:T9SS type A sorting domain-containing protein [Pontibacter sp. H249]|uniref:T9SS type A sorting domain-containing protein n=1 Tax=Pontibacter sp. H249 TaxID=3133420 RepID=UPI0030C59D10
MATITTLQHIVKFILSLLLALLPLHYIAAQEAPKTEKKLRIKYIERINGVETLKDTTVTITEMATNLQSFSKLKVDTAALRRLNSLTATLRDTTRFKMLANKNMKAYRLDGNLTDAERNALIDHLNLKQRDSLIQNLLKSGKLKELKGDSLHARAFKRAGKAGEFRVYTLRGAGADALYRSTSDTLKAVRIFTADSLTIVRPSRADNIYFRKRNQSDSLVFKLDRNSTYRIITKESTGHRYIYSLSDSANVKELGQKALQPARVMIVAVRKVTVQNLNTEDVATLKKARTPVETKPKEELALEEIEYYPNPNDGKFTLRFKPENTGTTIIRVLDSKGQEVFVDTVEKLEGEYSRQIDLTPFGKGLYFLQIAQGKRYHTKKILVQ